MAHLAWSAPVGAASLAPAAGNRSALRVVQMLDMSAEQQELSRDYSTGVRLAWATEARRARGAARVTLETLNTDGSAAAVEAAVARLQQDETVLALVGTVGDRLSVQAQGELDRKSLKLAHIAPWMSDGRHEAQEGVSCLFASRAVQLQQALTVMRGMGANELCVIYGSASEQTLYDQQVASIAQAQKLKLARLTGDLYNSAEALAARIPASSAMVLCLATSAELAQLTKAMAGRRDFRFVLALGDVDAPSLVQLGPGKGVPVILTQVVPNPLRSKLAVVENYRQQLNEFFEEAPSTISLAGYIAGLHALSLLRELGNAASRASVWAQVARHAPQDLSGWRVEFRDDHRGSRFVTHTLLTPSGELLG